MKRGTFFRFAAPSMFLMTLLMVIPLIMAIWLGTQFMTFANINAPQFVGLQNYSEVLSDSRFWQSFRFTALYALIVVPSTIMVGFTVAMMLDQVSKFTRGIYMSIFLLPFIIVPIVGTLMFKQLFEPSGLYTYLYQTILDTKFRYTEVSVKVLIILYGIWYVAPFAFVVYFAGLQTLSKDQIEAASI
ncbi:MAG: sugar ABC transporter permease, partial [Chloroflexi bacterium]|nr:sugar ABC transporter permease [Chloroflexota bacterium]